MQQRKIFVKNENLDWKIFSADETLASTDVCRLAFVRGRLLRLVAADVQLGGKQQRTDGILPKK
jgi:hypothetical protein